MGEEEPRRKRPRAGSAGKPRGMGAWAFMARKACTPPFPTLNPNPSRSFLSGGRGDYPKEFCESGSVRCPRILYVFNKDITYESGFLDLSYNLIIKIAHEEDAQTHKGRIYNQQVSTGYRLP